MIASGCRILDVLWAVGAPVAVIYSIERLFAVRDGGGVVGLIDIGRDVLLFVCEVVAVLAVWVGGVAAFRWLYARLEAKYLPVGWMVFSMPRVAVATVIFLVVVLGKCLTWL